MKYRECEEAARAIQAAAEKFYRLRYQMGVRTMSNAEVINLLLLVIAAIALGLDIGTKK